VHLTCAEALREVENARRRGQKVYVETCPQYLLLDQSAYDSHDWIRAAQHVCAPPLRTKRDQRTLWAALRRGEIQTVSTDHCSFTTEQKERGRGDFTAIPGGLPGVETRGELIYTAGVSARRISLAAMCRVLAENPAKLYGMYPRKGTIRAGSDADIVIYDPEADRMLRAEEMVGRAGYTPYEGFITRGSIAQVWLRGQLAVDNGTVLATEGGKYIPRGKCNL
jgi:dihydropyrimidinase